MRGLIGNPPSPAAPQLRMTSSDSSMAHFSYGKRAPRPCEHISVFCRFSKEGSKKGHLAPIVAHSAYSRRIFGIVHPAGTPAWLGGVQCQPACVPHRFQRRAEALHSVWVQAGSHQPSSPPPRVGSCADGPALRRLYSPTLLYTYTLYQLTVALSPLKRFCNGLPALAGERRVGVVVHKIQHNCDTANSAKIA